MIQPSAPHPFHVGAVDALVAWDHETMTQLPLF